jgi:hypothetical protein
VSEKDEVLQKAMEAIASQRSSAEYIINMQAGVVVGASKQPNYASNVIAIAIAQAELQHQRDLLMCRQVAALESIAAFLLVDL